MLTTTAVQDFLLSRSGLRPYSQRWYHKILRRFQEAFPGELPQEPQPIQGWLASLGHVEPETVHAYWRTLRALYNQARLWHPDLKNPMALVRPPRLKEKVLRTFSPDELYSLFSQPLPPRDRALLTLLLDTAIRAREVASITWENVRPGYIVVQGKGGREREVPISPETHRLLEALLPRSNGASGWEREPVFLGRKGPLTYEGIYKVVKRWCRRAGVAGPRLGPHTFRHTFGTAYAEAEGCNPKVLQQIMGHRDFKTTLRYLHVSRRSMIENHRLCTPLKGLEALAQGRLIREQEEVVREAEEILTRGER